jgi:hypothetical protein
LGNTLPVLATSATQTEVDLADSAALQSVADRVSTQELGGRAGVTVVEKSISRPNGLSMRLNFTVQHDEYLLLISGRLRSSDSHGAERSTRLLERLEAAEAESKTISVAARNSAFEALDIFNVVGTARSHLGHL